MKNQLRIAASALVISITMLVLGASKSTVSGAAPEGERYYTVGATGTEEVHYIDMKSIVHMTAIGKTGPNDKIEESKDQPDLTVYFIGGESIKLKGTAARLLIREWKKLK